VRFWVGKNGEKLTVRRNNKGRIKVKNATKYIEDWFVVLTSLVVKQQLPNLKK